MNTSSNSWLWAALHDRFDTDDGTLPEICIDYSDPAALIAGYALLLRLASQIPGDEATFWCKVSDASRPVDSVANAAALVVSGEAEAFHLMIVGIESRGFVLPDLGLFVFQDHLTLDYRMGAQWGAGEVEGLFELLAKVAALDPGASLSIDDGSPRESTARFRGAWARWNSERVLEP